MRTDFLAAARALRAIADIMAYWQVYPGDDDIDAVRRAADIAASAMVNAGNAADDDDTYLMPSLDNLAAECHSYIIRRQS